jgi:CarD family transcriptional regulator
MAIHETFLVGDQVVYPMHGVGWIKTIVTRMIEGQPHRFYQITIEGKAGGEVLVPVADARTQGLRFMLAAPEVEQVVKCLQRVQERPPKHAHSTGHYTWCKERLRQGDALGLADVRRFLFDLEQLESLHDFRLRQLRAYVCTQLPAEIAQALNCTQDAALRLVETALTSKRPAKSPTSHI